MDLGEARDIAKHVETELSDTADWKATALNRPNGEWVLVIQHDGTKVAITSWEDCHVFIGKMRKTLQPIDIG